MTGVCQEFCIQRIQTARWRDIANAQSFLVMQLRRETGYMGDSSEKNEENIEGKMLGILTMCAMTSLLATGNCIPIWN